ncbi:hypothetical protein [Streptomyces formicae]
MAHGPTDIEPRKLASLPRSLATMKLAEYGDANRKLALRGLELKTLDPYLSGWRLRVVRALKHLGVRICARGLVLRCVPGLGRGRPLRRPHGGPHR